MKRPPKQDTVFKQEEETTTAPENPFSGSYKDNRQEDILDRNPSDKITNEQNNQQQSNREIDSMAEYKKEQLRKLRESTDTARLSPVSFGMMSNNNANINLNNTEEIPDQDVDLNRQASKAKFLQTAKTNKFYLSGTIIPKISEYEVKTGDFIPAIMLSGINSDLPAKIIVALVRANVYDTVTGNYLLIPQGTRIVGTYDSNVTFGQNRLLVVWQRMIFPNGSSINLENMQGVDLTGKAGITGKVNNHFATLLKGVVLASIMGAAAAVITDENDTWQSAAANGAGEQIITIGDKFAERALSRQPTIDIKEGTRFNIMVHSDMILSPYSISSRR
ncbi:MAG: TrbI/VirB10 family protein [Fusobacteriaceae bacterium]|nr:TrbI/VirB10 family protein [Fusobacteriaceae bacterium]